VASLIEPPPSLAQACRRRLPLTLLALLLATGVARADLVTDVQTLIARGNASAALAATDQALAARPRDAQARFLRGVALLELARNDDALALFTELSQEYPELPEPHNNIALLQVRAGRLELARQALETALRNDPDHRIARLNLGEVHLMLAVQAWEKAAAAGPLDARMARRLDSARSLVAAAALPGR
jgi:tetratricopeptide (TPR) repeat protein